MDGCGLVGGEIWGESGLDLTWDGGFGEDDEVGDGGIFCGGHRGLGYLKRNDLLRGGDDVGQ